MWSNINFKTLRSFFRWQHCYSSRVQPAATNHFTVGYPSMSKEQLDISGSHYRMWDPRPFKNAKYWTQSIAQLTCVYSKWRIRVRQYTNVVEYAQLDRRYRSTQVLSKSTVHHTQSRARCITNTFKDAILLLLRKQPRPTTYLPLNTPISWKTKTIDSLL